MTVRPDSETVAGSGGRGKFSPRVMQAYIADYRGPQGDAPAIGDRGFARSGTGSCSAGADPRGDGRPQPAWLHPQVRGYEHRHLPGGRPAAVRTGPAGCRRRSADADGVGDRPAQPATRALCVVHEPGVPGPAQHERRVGRPSCAGRGRQRQARRGRRGLDTRRVGRRRRSQGAGGSQAPAAVGDHRRSAGRPRFHAIKYSLLSGQPDTLDNDSYSRFSANRRHEVARLLRWLDDGHFVLIGYQRCSVDHGTPRSTSPAVSVCCVGAKTCSLG